MPNQTNRQPSDRTSMRHPRQRISGLVSLAVSLSLILGCSFAVFHNQIIGLLTSSPSQSTTAQLNANSQGALTSIALDPRKNSSCRELGHLLGASDSQLKNGPYIWTLFNATGSVKQTLDPDPTPVGAACTDVINDHRHGHAHQQGVLRLPRASSLMALSPSTRKTSAVSVPTPRPNATRSLSTNHRPTRTSRC